MASNTSSSAAVVSPVQQFPPFSPDYFPEQNDQDYGRSSSPNLIPSANGRLSQDRWQPRRDYNPLGTARSTHGGVRHGRQKSLSEAIRTIRTRQGSVSANAHEIADALKAPISIKLILLCGLWYMSSILSNTSSKAILTALPKPVTLTVIQFAFVSSWCLFLGWLARHFPRLKTAIPALKHGIRPPSRDLIMTTLPLTLFQIGGHILSSDAMARIPVSLVHTIKGLSPLLTVLAYRLFLGIRYSTPTWLSLIPLTMGVIMACSTDFNANLPGLLYAFGSAILFVTQNIVSKKLFNEAALAEAEGVSSKFRKPDKLNLLCYSSGLAFLFTMPIWLWSEGFGLLGDFLQDASIDLTEKHGSLDHGRLTIEFIFNGTVHFAQNLIAFILLSLVSPVTYSVASLIKRVFVIVFAIVWFGNAITRVQALGIGLTFLGLYLYDRTSDADKADRRARALQLKDKDTSILPMVEERPESSGRGFTSSPQTLDPNAFIFPPPNGTVGHNSSRAGSSGGDKKHDGATQGRRSRASSSAGWLPPGTKQEETWKAQDIQGISGIAVS